MNCLRFELYGYLNKTVFVDPDILALVLSNYPVVWKYVIPVLFIAIPRDRLTMLLKIS